MRLHLAPTNMENKMFFLTLLTTFAFAQSSETKATELEFEDREVNATTKGPQGGRVVVRKRPPMPGMIKLRQHFHVEMINSTSDID